MNQIDTLMAKGSDKVTKSELWLLDITDKHISPPQHSTPPFSDQGSSMISDSVITRKDNELAILLSLSNEIAAVRSKNDLLQVLNIKLKKLFTITGFGITLVNEDVKTHSPFVVDSNNFIRNDIDFKKVIVLKYNIEDGGYNVIVNKKEPVLLNVDEQMPMVETAEYVALWKKLNVKQVIGKALAVAGRNIGCLILLLENDTVEKINEELMKGVCAAVSVAVSNIKSHEEIIRREEEKTLLLANSNEIGGLRTRNDFFAVINSQLKKIFSINRFGISNIYADRKTHNTFMIDVGDPVKGDEDFEYIKPDKGYI